MRSKIQSSLHSWSDAALSFFYPSLCQICKEERATADEGYVCASCWSGKEGVRFITAPFCERCGLPFEGEIGGNFTCSNCQDVELHFSWARSAVKAKGVVLEVIHRYKYQRALWFEPFLADLLIREARPLLQNVKWDFIVPVPLHPVKQREREFNQAELLSKRLSQAIEVPLNTKLLRRVEPTRTQTQLTREQRAENVKRAFAMIDGQKLSGEKIVLLDDVLTTGATTNACARVLRQAGASEVCVWTLARGL
jgi:competence protein ComFC